MRIAIFLDPFGEQHPSGLGRAIESLVAAIVRVPNAWEYTIYTKQHVECPPAWAHDRVQFRALECASMFFCSPTKIDRTHDAYLFLTPVIPLFFWMDSIAVIVHDFAYLELGQRQARAWIQSRGLWAMHQLSLLKARRVIAVSNTTREVLHEHFFISRKRVDTIYNGFTQPSDMPQSFPLPATFFLFAGVVKERKNVLGLIEAFARYASTHQEADLVIMGQAKGIYAERVQQKIRELALQRRVHLVGYRTNAELAYAYQHARALVFPSLVEGFGMPVLEAMSMGVPVITSREGALAEVAGDAAMRVDVRNSQELADALVALSGDSNLREDLVRRGRARAKGFSWERAAERYCALLAALRSEGAA